MWRVELLGKIQIVRGGFHGEKGSHAEVITRFESRKVACLLARLVLYPSRLHPREELAAYLWPDADRESGLSRLRHVLSSLKRQTRDDFLPPLFTADRNGVRLGSSVTGDVTDFENALRQKKWAEAHALYHGDFMPGFYDDWVVDEQARLQALWENAPASLDALPAPAINRAPAPHAVVRGLLPHYLTSFWGRENEKACFAALLSKHRLITIVGPVGCGKTRFLVEAVRESESAEEAVFERVAFVPLAGCAVPEQIAHHLRVALGLAASDEPPLEQIAGALQNVPLLLLLDNAEHLAGGSDVADAAGSIIEALLLRLPMTRCVVTSRRLLHVWGECAFYLSPLPTPPEDADWHTIRQNPAAALFCERAQAHRLDFALSERNAQAVAHICRALEGIPLAIAFAAGRVRAVSVQKMAQQLRTKEMPPASGSNPRWELTAPPALAHPTKNTPRPASLRHTSLRDAVAESWNLLSGQQQTFLASLSVLRGQWTRAFAVAASGETKESAARFLEELSDHSLIQLYFAPETEDDATGGEPRYALLQTVGDFAEEKLSSEENRFLRRRLCDYVLQNVQKAAGFIMPADIFTWEIALDYALFDGNTNESLALCAAFDAVWMRIGSPRNALTRVQQALALPGGEDLLRGKVGEMGIRLAVSCFDLPAAFALLETLRQVAQKSEHPRLLAYVRLAQARIGYARQQSALEILPFLDEAERLTGTSPDSLLQSEILKLRGTIFIRACNFVAAERDLKAAQELLQQAGDTSIRGNQVHYNRSVAAHESGDSPHALRLLDECLYEAERTHSSKMQADIRHNQGAILSEQGRWKESAAALQEAVRQMHRLGMEYGLAFALWNLATPLLHIGQTKTAVCLISFARAFWTENSGLLNDDEEAVYQTLCEKAAQQCGGEAAAAWQADGQKWSRSQAVQAALGGL